MDRHNIMDNSAKEGISDWLSGKSIFITGGAGFIGKLLLEKLLRTSKNIDKIYLLIRPKKNRCVEERVQEICQNEIMSCIREENPEIINKIVGIAGDLSLSGLGIDERNRLEIQSRCSIVFHIAASVRFDDSLKKAILTNVKGTLEVLNFCETWTNLEVFQHVSTAYCNLDRKDVVEEIIYPPHMKWNHIIELAENTDEEIFHGLTFKIMDVYPNTYTFSKQITESLVKDYSQRLPCVIVRPTIVVTTYKEPLAGWIDNFNGPLGLLFASGKGVLRTLYARNKESLDNVSGDKVIKGMVIAAWDKMKNKTDNECPVYHLKNNIADLHLDNLISVCLYIQSLSPLQKVFRTANTKIQSNYYLYYIQVLLWHILPALLADGLIILFGKKPILMKVVRLLFVVNDAFDHFLSNKWFFKEDRLKIAEEKLLPQDVESFQCSHYINMYTYIYIAFFGSRRFLVKDYPTKEQEKKNLRNYFWIKCMENTFKISFVVFLLYYVFKGLGLFV